MAYYHSVTRVCAFKNWSLSKPQIQGLKRVYAINAMGSSLMHGSHTHIGWLMDVNSIAFVSYLVHQISVSKLPGDSSILKELSDAPRSKDVLQVIEDYVITIKDENISKWGQMIETSDIQHSYERTFAAIVATGASLVLPWWMTEYVIDMIAKNTIGKGSYHFIVDKYLPELKASVQHVSVSFMGKQRIFRRFLSLILKAVYSFTWQELKVKAVR